MEAWIYIIIFVVVPIINRIIEMKKAGAEKAAAQEKRLMRNEARQRRRGSEKTQNPDPPAPISEETSWQSIDEPMTVDSSAGQDSWIQIPDSSPNPVQRQPEIDLPSPSGLEIFALPEPEEENIETEFVHGNPISSEEAFLVSPSDGSKAYQRSDIPTGDVHSKPLYSNRRSRFQLSKSQLRERLVWREILGPPLSLRRGEE